MEVGGMALPQKAVYLAKRVKRWEVRSRKRAARKPPIACPECASNRVWKDGVRQTKHGSIQRWLCRDCGLRFSESATDLKKKVDIFSQSVEQPNPGKNLLQASVFQSEFSVEPSLENLPLKTRENIASHTSSKQTIAEKPIYTFTDYNRECQSMRHQGNGAKNLVRVESQLQEAKRGATKPAIEVIVELQKFALWLQDEGIKQSSIGTYTDILLTLVKHGAILNQPETIRRVLGQQTSWKESYKHTIADIYSKYLDKLGLKWRKPRYQETNELIFIPSEKELQLAINCGSRENRVFTQFTYEVGCRVNEAEAFRWIDINRETRLVDIKKSKNGNPRQLKISSEVIDMLLSLPKNHETVFSPKAQGTRGIMFHNRMRTLARKSNNPRFLKIHLHTFRHCKALREYHKTRDILHVRYVLGHKTLRATQRYVEMYTHVYDNLKPQDYVVKIARTSEEAKDLLKVGFEFVNEIDGEYLYKKAKID